MTRARPTTADQQRALDEVYASMPRIECKGECWDSCGPIQMTRVEQRRIADRHRITLPLLSTTLRCPALTMYGTCSVYDDRPLICRLWGLVPSMACNFGCRPEGGLMSERDGFLLIARVAEITGDHAGAVKLRAVWATPESSAAAERFIQRREEARKHAWELRRDADERNGTALFVNRAGRVTSTRTERAHD